MSHAGTGSTHCSLRGSKEATWNHVASPEVQSWGFSSLQLPLEVEGRNYSERFGACACVSFAPPVSPAVSCSFIILREPSVKYGWPQRPACLSKIPSQPLDVDPIQYLKSTKVTAAHPISAAHKHRALWHYSYCCFSTGEEHACACLWLFCVHQGSCCFEK